MSSVKATFASASEIIEDLSAILAPPARGESSSIADDVFYLPEGTRYESELTPYMVEPMNLVKNRKFKATIMCAPARSSKTLSLIDANLATIISTRPSDCLVIFATDQMARRYARMRFDRMVKNSPKLRNLLTDNRHEDNVLNKSFKNGMAVWLGSPTPTNLSASDYRYCFWSDVDRGDDTNADGDIFTQLLKRNQTFLSSGMTFAEASPSRDILDPNWKPKSKHEAPPVSGILGLYNDGDRRMYYWKCPHCDEYFKISADLELFQLPPEKELLELIHASGEKKVAKKFSKIYCSECGCQIEQHMKTELNETGKWFVENPEKENDIASFWLGGICAKFQSWDDILQKYFKALVFFDETGNESKLKAVFNVDIAMPFMPKMVTNIITARELELRAVNLEKHVVPEGVRYLLAAIDVQKSKFVVQVEGYGVNEVRWIVDRFDITLSNRVAGGVPQGIDPATYAEDWEVLKEKVILKRYALQGKPSMEMGIIMTVCDSGGTYSTISDSSVTENAYKFWLKMKNDGLSAKFNLIKGTRPTASSNNPAIKKSVLTKQSATARKTKVIGQLPLWLINTTLLKDTAMAQLKRTETGIGYTIFPEWLPSWFYRELTAEIRTEKGWENLRQRRNESFDLICYNKVGHLILIDKYWSAEVNWESPPAWAETWENNSEVSDNDKFKQIAPANTTVTRPKRGSITRRI